MKYLCNIKSAGTDFKAQYQHYKREERGRTFRCTTSFFYWWYFVQKKGAASFDIASYVKLCGTHTLRMLRTTILHHQSERRSALGINSLSPSLTPKASYHISMCGRAPFTRQRPSACGSLFVRLRISASVILAAHTPA